jgi:polyhydroxyalkanoate synthesis regulator phasin
MRTAAVAIVAAALVLVPPARAGEKDLLERFKRQNQQAREKLEAEIKQVLEQAQAVEKDEPAKAIGILQDARDKLLQKGLLTTKEDRTLAEPLWERIQLLRGTIRGKQGEELRVTLADYKEYLARMNEEFAKLRAELIPPAAKEAPPGGPAFIAFVGGSYAAGWMHESPQFVVNATVNDQQITYAPGVVAGVQTPSGFFVYHTGVKRFQHLSPAEFFLTAITSYPPARRPGFWMPSDIPPPPPGLYKRSLGAEGAALFAHSAGALTTTWAGPGGQFPERGPGASNGSAAGRLYREVMVELLVHEVFLKLKREDQNRIRDLALTFLDRRPRDEPLSSEEIVRFSDTVTEAYADRRADALAFAHRFNRILEQNAPPRK